MTTIDVLGYLAACCTTAAFVPQAVRVHRTRSTEDLSLAMFGVFTLGVLFWLAYGILVDSKPIIVANAITAVLSGYILSMKLREKKA